MAVFSLEDLQASVEVMVFPKTMQRATATSSPTTPSSCVKGRVDSRDDQPKLIAMEIERVRADHRRRAAAAHQAVARRASPSTLLGRPQGPAARAPRRVAGVPPPRRAPGAAPARRVHRRRRRPASWPSSACCSGPTRDRGLNAALTRGSRSLEQVVRDLSSGSRVAPERRIYWTRGLRTTSDPGAGSSMAIEVETKDCTALGDAELAEMADLCADGPSRLRGRDCCRSRPRRGCWSPRPARATRSRASRSARSSASAARPCVLIGLASVKRTVQARHRAAGDHARPAPPGRAGLPRRGRPRRHPLHQRRRLRGLQDPQRHRAPARPQGHRRGAGLGPAPGQALRRRDRRLRRPHLHRQGRRQPPRWCSTTRA